MNDTGVLRALGSMAMIFDIIPTFARPKLSRVEPGTAEFDYMLATIVFDLVKKNALAHKALRSFLLHADPELTSRVMDDVRELRDLDQNYEALAHRTEDLMLEAVGEVLDDHMALGELLERWNASERGSEPARSS